MNIFKKSFLFIFLLLIIIGVTSAAEINETTADTLEKTTPNTEITSNDINTNNQIKTQEEKDNNNEKVIEKSDKNIKKASNEKLIVDEVSYDANNASLLLVKARLTDSQTNEVIFPYDLDLYVEHNKNVSVHIPLITDTNTAYFYYGIENKGNYLLTINSSKNKSLWVKNITINKVYTGRIPLKLDILNYTPTVKTNETLVLYAKVTDTNNKPMAGMFISVNEELNGKCRDRYVPHLDDNGCYNLTYDCPEPGKYNITIDLQDTDIYYSRAMFNLTPKTVSINVNKITLPDNLKLKIDEYPESMVYDKVLTITGQVVDKNNKAVPGVVINLTSDKNISYWIGDTEGTIVTSSDAVFMVHIYADVGNYSLNFTIDDKKYANKSQIIKYQVTPKDVNISINNIPSTITNARSINITAQLTDKYGKLYLYDDDDILFKINNKVYPSYNEDFSMLCNFYPEKTGNYTVVAMSNNKNYKKVNVTKTFTVKSLNTTKIDEDIYLDLINMTNKTKTVSYDIMTTSHYYNIPLVVKINNFTDYIYSGDGRIIYNYTPKENGVYNISVAYNTQTFKANKANSTFTIKNWYASKDNVIIKTNPINITSINKTTIISGTLYNQNNKTLANKTVIIQDAGFKTQVKTDNKGYYSYTYKVTSGNGTHNVTITVPETDTTNKANITQTFKCRTPTEIFINYTQANVNKTFNITVTIKNPLNYSVIYPNAKLTVKIANTTYNTKTNANGSIPLNYTASKEETINVTATFAGSNNYDPSNKTIQIKITDYVKDLEKKIKEYEQIMKTQNNTIKNLNNTVKTQNATINNLNNTVKSLNNTVKTQNATINNLNSSVKSLNNTVKTQNATINNLNSSVKSLNSTVKTQNATISNLNKTNKNLNATVNNLNNTVKSLNNTVKTQNATISNLNKTNKNLNATVNSLNNTIKNQNNTIKSLNNNITNLQNQIKNIQITKQNTKITVNKIIGTVGKTSKITANIVDQNNNKVNEGYVIYKINGITLKDKTGNTIITEVKNGITTLNYEAQKGWLKNTTQITATYLGSEHYKTSTINKTGLFNISNGTVKIKISDLPVHENGENTQFVITVTDTNNNPLNGGTVIVKANGVTLKDAKGKALQATVQNGVAIFDYKIQLGARIHNITAVYANTGYTRAENSTNLTVTKGETFIRYEPITTKTNYTIIAATIVDKNKKAIYTNTTVGIKIDGKTVATTKAVNGVINVVVPTNHNKGVHTIVFTAGETGAFKSDRLTSVIIKE